MQRVLQPVQVRNPFAESLHIPDEVFKPRRSNAHYLAFIEAVTFTTNTNERNNTTRTQEKNLLKPHWKTLKKLIS